MSQPFFQTALVRHLFGQIAASTNTRIHAMLSHFSVGIPLPVNVPARWRRRGDSDIICAPAVLTPLPSSSGSNPAKYMPDSVRAAIAEELVAAPPALPVQSRPQMLADWPYHDFITVPSNPNRQAPLYCRKERLNRLVRLLVTNVSNNSSHHDRFSPRPVISAVKRNTLSTLHRFK